MIDAVTFGLLSYLSLPLYSSSSRRSTPSNSQCIGNTIYALKHKGALSLDISGFHFPSHSALPFYPLCRCYTSIFFLFLLFVFLFHPFFSFSLYLHFPSHVYPPALTAGQVVRRDMRDSSLFSAVQYIDDFRNLLQARRFTVMESFRATQTTRTACHGRKRDAPVGAWKRPWWHWGVCRPSELNFCFPNTGFFYIRCYEKAGYESCMAPLRPTSVKSLRWSSPSFWTMLSQFRFHMIYFM